jgi:hypothetical protein
MINFQKRLTRGIQSALDKTSIEDGKLRFTTDTGRLFLDNGSDRIEITDFIKGKTEEEILDIIAPLPKFYYANDTHAIFVHDGSEWVKCCDRVSFADTATNASTATYANKSLNDANGEQINTFYAPLSSPMFTGNPTVPTPSTGSKDLQIANTEFVMNMIASAIAEIVKFDTEVVSQLPETGKPGVIYFILSSDQTSGENIYDEYIWVDNKFESIGSTKINLSGYYNTIEVSGTGNAITGVNETENGLQFQKGASFLTEHPSVSKNSSTATEKPNGGSTIEVVDSVTVDSYGHLVGYRKKTVTLPNSVSNASTANYATYASDIVNGADIDFGDLDE